MEKKFKNRFSLLFAFILTYIILSFFTRMAIYVWSFPNMDFSIISLFRVIATGLFFDFGTAIYFILFYSIYLLLIPKKVSGTWIDKTFTYFIITITLFLALFGLIGEFPFWDEFSKRYNFIAVDYLIYTYEVIQNINQSYPIPLILLFLFVLIGFIYYLYNKKNVFKNTFSKETGIFKRILTVAIIFAIAIFYTYNIKNKQAEWSNNSYENELSKNGVYSLFAAYRSNELDYNTFYKTIPEKEAYSIIKKDLKADNQSYADSLYDNIKRTVKSEGLAQTPNIILVTVESLSAEFLGTFGNKDNLTPFLDSLIQKSIVFTNLYATGTRTVRGMEALTLSVPPTPGQSIVRRPDNENLFSIATVLKQKNYHLDFLYGGDGYFDNMNYFFGSQGFDIVDRNRGNILSDKIKTKRYSITDDEVTFENAWGICDEDIFKQSIKFADTESKQSCPFFQFIMTTSNHRPYSFPKNAIDSPQGTRGSAVKYTDYSFRKFFEAAQKKPWFKNTVFVIIADHCEKSAGKWEINIDKYHIPAIIYNLNNEKGVIKTMCSQMDLMPTLFGLLNWSYDSEFIGQDVTRPSYKERAFLGNYRTLGLLKNNIFTQLNDRKTVIQFTWDGNKKKITEDHTIIDKYLEKLTISYFQTASNRFKEGKMKENYKY